MSWGISSNGRAPALHAGGTGIDTRILQFYFLLLPLLVLIIFFPYLYFSVVISEVGKQASNAWNTLLSTRQAK